MKEIFFTSIGLLMIMFGGYQLLQGWEALQELRDSIASIEAMSSILGVNAEALAEYVNPEEYKKDIYYHLFIYGCVFIGGVIFLLLPRLEKQNQSRSRSLLEDIEIGQDIDK